MTKKELPMDPKIMDLLKIALMYHLTRYLAGGVNPPTPSLFLKMEEREHLMSRYGQNMATFQAIGVIINRFSGEENDVSRQFERENPDIVKHAIAKICAIQEFKDFLSWYVDIRAIDGLPQCRSRAEECGLYVKSSIGKDQLCAYMRGVSDMQVPVNSSPRGSSKGNGCLIPIALIGSSLLGMILCVMASIMRIID